MPSSVSGRLISGSWTVARAALTASSAGEPVIVSDIVACVSFDGGTASAGCDLPEADRPPLYGGRHGVAPGGEVSCCAPRWAEPPQVPSAGEDDVIDRCTTSGLRPSVVGINPSDAAPL